MNRDTLVLLAMIFVVGVLVSTALMLIVDAMVLDPPTTDTALRVTGSVST